MDLISDEVRVLRVARQFDADYSAFLKYCFSILVTGMTVMQTNLRSFDEEDKDDPDYKTLEELFHRFKEVSEQVDAHQKSYFKATSMNPELIVEFYLVRWNKFLDSLLKSKQLRLSGDLHSMMEWLKQKVAVVQFEQDDNSHSHSHNPFLIDLRTIRTAARQVDSDRLAKEDIDIKKTTKPVHHACQHKLYYHLWVLFSHCDVIPDKYRNKVEKHIYECHAYSLHAAISGELLSGFLARMPGEYQKDITGVVATARSFDINNLESFDLAALLNPIKNILQNLDTEKANIIKDALVELIKTVAPNGLGIGS